MKYIQFKGKYYIMEKDSKGKILLIPAVGLDEVKAWARLVILEANKQGAFEDIKFVRAGNSVICLCEPNGRMCGEYWGMAVCRHENSNFKDDEFDFEIGKAISYFRAIGAEVPGFVFEENAYD